MSFKTCFFAGLLAASMPTLAAADMMVHDGYARSSNAQSGAAFLSITNDSDRDDRVIGVSSAAAARVELHTHIEDDNGVMRMREVEAGFAIPAGETFSLQRGGDHFMFMGLTSPWEQDDEITITIEFEHADPVTFVLPVDLERRANHGTTTHGQMGHGDGHGNHASN